jgi:hypothetical protein
MPAVPADIRDFFVRYRDAFDRLDGEAIARLYAIPSALVSPQGYFHWADFDSIKRNMAALCHRYRGHGYRSARFEFSGFLALASTFAVVDLLWHIERTGDYKPWRFHTGYNLRRHDTDWRVQFVTAYEETALNG